MGALLPTPPGINAPYQRSQYGADFGGRMVADKLFFFMDGERTLEHTNAPLPVSAPFSQYSGTFPTHSTKAPCWDEWTTNGSAMSTSFIASPISKIRLMRPLAATRI